MKAFEIPMISVLSRCPRTAGFLCSITTFVILVHAIPSESGRRPGLSEPGDVFAVDSAASASLPDMWRSSVALGDYDNDGDLDILLSGATDVGSASGIYRNDAGTFTDAGVPLLGLFDTRAAWGDFDNDGDLDILLTGRSGARYSKIYENVAGSFSDIGAGLTRVSSGGGAWGDYDNDGDLDVLLTGETGFDWVSEVYRNDAGTFVEIGAGLLGVSGVVGHAAWGDFDNDGDLDIALSGSTGTELVSRIYRNDNGAFFDIGAGVAQTSASVTWGDYDNDGDLDLLLMDSVGGRGCLIYRNDNGTFTDIEAGLSIGSGGNIGAWGDYDNDGDLDILTNNFEVPRKCIVYRNDAGIFVDINAGLMGVDAAGAWGDYDNDGDLDILLTGSADGTATGATSLIYRNNIDARNTPPSPPSGLSLQRNGPKVTVSWDVATDAETPASALTYNLRVGTTPGGSEIVSPMADGVTGYRQLVQLGNVNQNRTWTIDVGSPAQIFWSVQAIDHGYAGSAFAGEESAQIDVFDEDMAASAGLPGVARCSVAWGDYDDDGDLDILLTGGTGTGFISSIYENIGGTFTDIQAGLAGVDLGNGTWGDYDNDGDLDVLLTGNIPTAIYENRGGNFVDIEAGLIPVVWSDAAWGDYDNDGDLDVLLTGGYDQEDFATVYRNDDGIFTDIGASLVGATRGSGAWGDYDNDGDLDILLTGLEGSNRTATVYENTEGLFVDIDAGLTGLDGSDAEWGDYDNDGDLDILSTGFPGFGLAILEIYENTQGIFTDIEVGLPGVSGGNAAWGDYDNDGDLDVLLTGATGIGYISRVYRNDAGAFTDLEAGLIGLDNESFGAWGDYDNDGDLDILLSGSTDDFPSVRTTRIYRNDIVIPNTRPQPPTNLVFQLEDTLAAFSWDAAIDAETPSSGLTYNLRVGTSCGGSEILSAMADATTGLRKVVELGNMNHNTSWSIDIGTAPRVCWSVQAVDHSFAGSAFAVERSMQLGPILLAIEDVPDDEGGWVRLDIGRSDLDDIAETQAPIVHYNVWRRVDESTPASASLSLPPGTWESLGTFAAAQQETYVYIAATRGDSSDVGIPWAVYVASAHTANPEVWFISEPDSGYSVDNFSTAVRLVSVHAAREGSDVVLSWEVEDTEVPSGFHVYRQGFGEQRTKLTQELLEGQALYEFVDRDAPREEVSYWLEEIGWSGVAVWHGPITLHAVASKQPRLMLAPAQPNPFRESTEIRFSLRATGHVSLAVYDVLGRRIRTLVDGHVRSGVHDERWDGRTDSGVRVSPGVYFLQLSNEGEKQAQRILFIR
ncbi:MAG: T9SS type A sorting domain-containing protein [Candidatus Latescibacterota bacterium]|nr:MAG: T9SS type A sorting domain-containing protein [Candidatus Latescibacterota bacterium]